MDHMTSFCFHALFQVTVIDENGENRRVFRGITDDMYSEVQGFSVSAAVNVSKSCFEEHVLINVQYSQHLNAHFSNQIPTLFWIKKNYLCQLLRVHEDNDVRQSKVWWNHKFTFLNINFPWWSYISKLCNMASCSLPLLCKETESFFSEIGRHVQNKTFLYLITWHPFTDKNM